jgi:dipeptidyl aminopeptidase/acylaminoacyl peptidase
MPPTPVPPDPRIYSEDLRFRSARPGARRGREDAPVIVATLYLPATAAPGQPLRPGLVVGHGAGSTRLRHRAFAHEACLAGFVVLGIDFRGHGDSGGTLDGPVEDDILAAAALLRTHPLVDGRRICYRGSSMGGYYGVRAAADADFAAIALICAANEDVLLRALDEKRDWSQAESAGLVARLDEPALRTYFSSHDVLDTAQYIDCPSLLIHARGDERVPARLSADLALALAGETHLLLLPDGDHSSAQGTPAIHRMVTEWLLKKVGGLDGTGARI